MTLELLLALSQLDPVMRETFVDYALCEMTQEQIAERDGVTRSAVGSRIKRAREKLRELLPDL